MDWIKELSPEDIDAVLEKDVQLVYQQCGLDVLIALWKELKGLNLYISEKGLHELRKIFIRTNYNPEDPQGSLKALAVKLECSEQFVRDSLRSTAPVKDDRQMTLL